MLKKRRVFVRIYDGDKMKKKYGYLILMLFWMSLIFYFSAQPAAASNQTSDSILIKLLDFFSLSVTHDLPLWGILSFAIRKLAHMSEYAILSMLAFGFFKECNCKRCLFYAWLWSVGYACSDEFHQLFVLGRSGELRDVCIDAIGAGIGVLIIVLVMKWMHNSKEMSE